MRFYIDDKVRATVTLFGVDSLKGTITGIDRTRQQYAVDFNGKEIWLYDNELTRDYEMAEPDTKCRHKFVPYVGLTEQFNFCKYCDIREEM